MALSWYDRQNLNDAVHDNMVSQPHDDGCHFSFCKAIFQFWKHSILPLPLIRFTDIELNVCGLGM